MSSKIYFNENNHRNFSWWLARGITNSILTLPRAISLKVGKKMLLQPVRKKSTSIPENMTVHTVKTAEGEVQTYKIGTGPIILLSHGWSGSASQFFPLMARIAEAGYQAVAYDQIAHGNSSGVQSNLFLFIKIKQAMVAWLEREQPIAAIVTHSMGAYASLAALTSPYPILLISPVFKLIESMFERVEQSGMARQLLINVVQDLEQEHQMEFINRNINIHIANYLGKIHIIHDEVDQFALLKDSKAVADEHSHVMLTTTKNLGHGRIISSEDTWVAFNRMMETARIDDACGENDLIATF